MTPQCNKNDPFVTSTIETEPKTTQQPIRVDKAPLGTLENSQLRHSVSTLQTRIKQEELMQYSLIEFIKVLESVSHLSQTVDLAKRQE